MRACDVALATQSTVKYNRSAGARGGEAGAKSAQREARFFISESVVVCGL